MLGFLIILGFFLGFIVGFMIGCVITWRNHNLYPEGHKWNRKEQTKG